MARIIVTTLASADQAAIFNHLHARAGLGTVVKFRSLFGALYDRLADHPVEADYQSAELQKGMPFTATAGKARALDCEHNTSCAGTDRCQQALESRSHSAVTRVTEIFINNDHILPNREP